MRKESLLLTSLMLGMVLSGCIGDNGGEQQADEPSDSMDDMPGDGQGMPPPDDPEEPGEIVVGETVGLSKGTIVHGADGRVLADEKYPGRLPTFIQRYVANRSAGEPTIAVTTEGAIYPSIAFDSSVAGLAKTIVYMTEDDGRTWQDRNPQITDDVERHPASLDPYVYADPATGRIFTMDLYVGCSEMSWSDNMGLSWETNPVACGIPVNDHQTLFSGPPVPPTITIGYPSVLYYCINQVGDATCTHSIDGGYTWLDGEAVYPGLEGGNDPSNSPNEAGNVCGGLHGHGHASQATGLVYLPKGHCGKAWVSISADNGNTWELRLVDNTVGFDGHEAIVSTDSEGNAYYFFLDQDTYPHLSVSHDGGYTWQAPLNVTRPGVTAAKFPSIVAGDEGRIAFLYVGTETPSGWASDDTDGGGNFTHREEYENATWNVYVGFSLNALDLSPVFATTTANAFDDPVRRQGCAGRCSGMYDFLDIDIQPETGQVWAAIVDLCNNNCTSARWTQEEGWSEYTQNSRGAVGVQVGGDMLRTTQLDAAT